MAQHILVIDDDRTLLKIIGAVLRQQGYEVDTATAAEDGLKAAKTAKPDLVILDVMLPNMNGYEMCRTLRHEQETAQVPILMLTALGRQADQLAGFAVGADDYLAKPVSALELVSRVRSMLYFAEGVPQ